MPCLCVCVCFESYVSATARLAGLQFEHGDGDDGDDQEWAMESPAKKPHHDDDSHRKDSASSALTGIGGVARRQGFNPPPRCVWGRA